MLQITIFFKRRAAYIKGCYSQNMVRCFERISNYAFRTLMCNCEGHSLRAYMYHAVFISENILWKEHYMRKRVHFWHRSRLRHDLLQCDALPFFKKCTCWREHSLQTDASLLFKGILQSVWICVKSRVWANNVNIKINSTHSLAAYVFAFVQHRFEKIYKQTKLPNLCPKPPKLPPVIPAFCHGFLHCFLMEPQAQSNQ